MKDPPMNGIANDQWYKSYTVVLELPRRQGDELAEIAARTRIEKQAISVTLLTETDAHKARYAISMPRGLFSSVTGLMLCETNKKPQTNLIYMVLRDQMALNNSNVPPAYDSDDIPF